MFNRLFKHPKLIAIDYLKIFILFNSILSILFAFFLLPRLSVLIDSEAIHYLAKASKDYGLAAGVIQTIAIVILMWIIRLPAVNPHWRKLVNKTPFTSTKVVEKGKMIDILKVAIFVVVVSTIFVLSLSLYLYINE